ncbi:MAG: hypothetical protein HPZ91_07350 [Lentisphaeria bacterium]|nr:hypothetical protein [Lentisphaeria bacterium]
MIVDTSLPRYAHFAGMPETKIRQALWLADCCIAAARATFRQREIDEFNHAEVKKLCDEIDASSLSFSEWLKTNNIQLDRKETGHGKDNHHHQDPATFV